MKITMLTVGASNSLSLDATYRSLESQTHTDWEWLIGVPAGSTVRILDSILADPRVKVVDGKPTSLYSQMTDIAKGEFFVTLPPGAELNRPALGMLKVEYEKDRKYVLFPAFATRRRPPYDDESEADANWWWSTFDFDRNGQRIQGCHAPPLVPSLAGYEIDSMLPTVIPRIYAALVPEILKAAIVGGVPSREVETATHILPDSLNPTGTKVWMQGLDASSKSVNLAKRVVAVAKTWSENQNLMIWEGSVYGAANNKTVRLHPTDFMVDGRPNGWPLLAGFPDDSVGMVTLTDFLPFMPGPNVIRLFMELHRLLRHGGILRVEVPTTRGQAAWANPAYRSWWNERSFEAFTHSAVAKASGNRTARFAPVWQTSGFRTDDGKQADMLFLDIGLAALKDNQHYPAPQGI